MKLPREVLLRPSHRNHNTTDDKRNPKELDAGAVVVSAKPDYKHAAGARTAYDDEQRKLSR